MSCALFAKMDQIFSLKKQNIKKILEKMAKDTGKVREFCQSGKVGTLINQKGNPGSSWERIQE